MIIDSIDKARRERNLADKTIRGSRSSSTLPSSDSPPRGTRGRSITQYGNYYTAAMSVITPLVYAQGPCASCTYANPLGRQ